MKIKLTFLAVSVALGLSTNPETARSQILGGAFCFPSAFQACASISLRSIEFDPTIDATVFSIRIINLEGQPGVPDSGPFGIYEVDLTNVNMAQPCAAFDGICNDRGAPQVSGSGTDVVTNGVVTCTFPDCTVPTLPGVSADVPWDFTAYTTGVLNASVQSHYFFTTDGCTVRPIEGFVGPTPTYIYDYSTCQAGSYVDLFLRPVGHWTLSNASELTVRGVLPGESSISCTFDVNCVPLSVTPEPVTLTLLGTGLAGIGGVALKRRRRKAIA